MSASDDFCDLLRKMLDKSPATRSTLLDIKTHKWMCLSDAAIDMKADLAKTALRRKLQE